MIINALAHKVMFFFMFFHHSHFLNEALAPSVCVFLRSSFQWKSPRVSHGDDQLSDPAGSNSEVVLTARWSPMEDLRLKNGMQR